MSRLRHLFPASWAGAALHRRERFAQAPARQEPAQAHLQRPEHAGAARVILAHRQLALSWRQESKAQHIEIARRASRGSAITSPSRCVARPQWRRLLERRQPLVKRRQDLEDLLGELGRDAGAGADQLVKLAWTSMPPRSAWRARARSTSARFSRVDARIVCAKRG